MKRTWSPIHKFGVPVHGPRKGTSRKESSLRGSGGEVVEFGVEVSGKNRVHHNMDRSIQYRGMHTVVREADNHNIRGVM